jgi:hypothetical protein
MGKKNNIYTASYKLKVLSVAEQFGNRAALRQFGILDCNVRYWRKQNGTVGHIVVRKLQNRHILRTPIFGGQTRTKRAPLTQVLTVQLNCTPSN